MEQICSLGKVPMLTQYTRDIIPVTIEEVMKWNISTDVHVLAIIVEQLYSQSKVKQIVLERLSFPAVLHGMKA